MDVFIEEIIDVATFVPTVEEKFEYPRDPKDEPYINLAGHDVESKNWSK